MVKKFEEQQFKNNKLDFKIWKKVFSHLGKAKKLLIVTIIIAILSGFLEVLLPFYISDVIKQFEANQNLDSLQENIIIFSIIIVSFSILMYFHVLLAGKIQTILSYNLRKACFVKLQKLPFEFYDKKPIGWLMARMTSDASRLAHILSWGMTDILFYIFILTFVLVIMFIVNAQLALVALIALPIISILTYWFRKIMLKHSRKIRAENSKITGAYNEGLTGANTTKILAIEKSNQNDFEKLTRSYYRSSRNASIFSSFYWSLIIILFGMAMGSIYYIAAKDVVGSGESLATAKKIAEIVLFVSLMNLFFDPIMSLSRLMVEFQEGQASAERIISLVEEEPSIVDTEEVIEKYGDIFNYKLENFEELEGDVKFENVEFKYNDEEIILKDFNLEIKKGTSVALVGETGAGKSTIVNLLARFYEPTKGIIKIDNVDYKERSLGWLHSNLGYVLQTPFLFSGNILENIRYGKIEATDEEVIEAAKYVGAHTFIEKLTNGYQTTVGEGGNRLSVGEKQLISFARAILKNPAILILDEATSSIDTKTEDLLQTAIEKLLKGRTSFSIAHRLSTIINSDLILVLKKGKIIEKGTHNELLKNKGYYYDLYNSQFKNKKST